MLGLGPASGLITAGVGTSIVTVTTTFGAPAIRPSLQRFLVDYEYTVPLMQLGIIVKHSDDLELIGLSLAKEDSEKTLLKKLTAIVEDSKEIILPSLSLSKISRIQFLLSHLDVVLSIEAQTILRNLILITFDEEADIHLDDLRLINREQKQYQVSTLALIRELRKQINTQIPDIYILKMKALANYLDLMDLLDYIDIAEE